MSDATTTAAATSEATTLIGGDSTGATTAAAATTAATTEGATTTAATTTTTTEPTAEEKAAADKAAADKAAADAKAAGAPEAYEAFTLPEGLTADTPVLGEFAALAKEANLPQATAQKFVDLAGKMQTQTIEGVQTALEAQGDKWGQDAKADKEFGGDAFDANLAIAKTALDTFGTPELKSLLNQSKLGNHPEVLRAFVRIGKAISQDGFVPGRNSGSAKSFFDKSPELH